MEKKADLVREINDLREKLRKKDKEITSLKQALLDKGWTKRAVEALRFSEHRYPSDHRRIKQFLDTKSYDQMYGLEQSKWTRPERPRMVFYQLLKGLGISLRDFGLCYGVSRQAVQGLMERESRWALRLDTLWNMAAAIDCELVVRVRPRGGLMAKEQRMLAAYKMMYAYSQNHGRAIEYAEMVGRGGKMNWAKWAKFKREGRL